MSFFEVLNLKVYWNKETESFINTAIPIHDGSAKVIDIILDEVLRVDSSIKRDDIDCDRDIISAKSASNKDVIRLYKDSFHLCIDDLITISECSSGAVFFDKLNFPCTILNEFHLDSVPYLNWLLSRLLLWFSLLLLRSLLHILLGSIYDVLEIYEVLVINRVPVT